MKMSRTLIREIYTLAWPVIVGQLGHIMLAVVDNAMVGQLGAEDLAAVALANSLFVLLMVVGLGVSFAVSPLVSMAVGSNDRKQCQELLPHSLLVNISISVALFLIIYFSGMLIPIMGQSAIVAEKAGPYLLLLGTSIFPLMLFQTYKQYIEGMSIMRPAMVITLLANIVNYIGNKALIYGTWGFPRMGINGAGVSTLLTRIFMALAIIAFVYRARKSIKYPISLHLDRINWVIIKKIYHLGLGSGFQYFFEVGSFTFAVIMIGWLGAIPQAAHQIAINLASVSYMIALGISAASAILVGRYYGAKDWARLKLTGLTAIFLGAANMGVFGIVFIIWRNILPTFYTSDQAVIQSASSLLILAAIFQIFDGVQAVGLGALRGMADVRFPTIITFVSYWLIGLSLAYIFGFLLHMQVVGVWIGLSAGLASAAILLFYRFYNLASRH